MAADLFIQQLNVLLLSGKTLDVALNLDRRQ